MPVYFKPPKSRGLQLGLHSTTSDKILHRIHNHAESVPVCTGHLYSRAVGFVKLAQKLASVWGEQTPPDTSRSVSNMFDFPEPTLENAGHQPNSKYKPSAANEKRGGGIMKGMQYVTLPIGLWFTHLHLPLPSIDSTSHVHYLTHMDFVVFLK